MTERNSLFQTPIECAKIMQIVPQKFPFLYVDRVLELEPGVSAVALKNVTINEDYFPGHFVHEPVIPGTIFIEIAAQVTGIINAAANGIPGSRGMIVKMEDVRARAKVVPGAFATVRVAAALPKDRSAAAQAALATLVNEAKQSGVVQKATRRVSRA